MANPHPLHPRIKKIEVKLISNEYEILKCCQKALGKCGSEIMRMGMEEIYYGLNDDCNEKYFHQIYKKVDATNLKIGNIKYVKIGYAAIYQDYCLRKSVTIPKVLYKDSYVIKNEDDFTGKATKKKKKFLVCMYILI